MRFVLAGMVLLGIASSTIGTFAFLRKDLLPEMQWRTPFYQEYVWPS